MFLFATWSYISKFNQKEKTFFLQLYFNKLD